MKPEFLESAEFYNRRYHNFSSSVIVPMALLLVFLLGFATVAEKEMSLSTRATVEPSRILANIQSTSNNRILVNHPQLFTPNLKTIQNPCLSLDPGWFLF
ncbi:hypothetical protein OK838_09520, partial [Streptococcus pneumoniae]|nr:hypothetical protein [Streptococcus pneumoniae]